MEGSKNRKKGSLQRQAFRDLLGGLVVRTPSFQRRECGFKPSSGNLDSADPTCHMVWQKNNKKTKTSFHSWNFISPMNMLFFFFFFSQSIHVFHREACLVPNPNQQQHFKKKKAQKAQIWGQ